MTIRENWGISVPLPYCISSTRQERDPTLTLPLEEIMSDPINTDITLCDDNLSRHRHNGVITHSYYVGTIRTGMNKNTVQENKIYMALSESFSSQNRLPKPPVPLQIWDLEQEGSESAAAGSVKWITSQCEKQCG